jgi:hypothetical protein
MINITVGADPEVFARIVGGKHISAWGLVRGNKSRPYPVDFGAVQVDGMALEFNIDPAKSKTEFILNLNTVADQLEAMLPEGLELSNRSSVVFGQEIMCNSPPQALQLGCERDMNAYTMKYNPKPDGDSGMRTAGGHVHVGGLEGMGARKMAQLARIMDERIGTFSLLWDKDDKRRSMYGQAGALRDKKYGMEYRTLSNAWIFGVDLTSFVYDGVQESVKLLEENYEPDPVVRQIINNSLRDHEWFRTQEKAKLFIGG